MIGSIVVVEDLDSGAVNRYQLASAHNSFGPGSISAASPMGQALVGAAAGTVVTVDLPNGSSRRVRLTDVTTEGGADVRSPAAA